MRAVVFLCLIVLVAFVLLGRMSGDLENTQAAKSDLEAELQTANQTLAQVRARLVELEQALTQASAERDQAVSSVEPLQQSLAVVQQKRDEALTQVATLTKQIQDLKQVKVASDPGLSSPPQQVSRETVIALAVMLVVVSYPGLRRLSYSMRKLRLQTATPATTVSVQVPRAWMRDYARWVRQMQMMETDRLTDSE